MIQTRPYFYPSFHNSWSGKKQEKASSQDATNALPRALQAEHQQVLPWIPPSTGNLRFGYVQPKRSERLAKTEELTAAFSDSLKEIQDAKGNPDLQVINLGVGDSDIPPSPQAIQAMIDSLEQINGGPKVTRSYRYIPYNGDIQFFKTVSQWMKQRFNADIDPGKEVIAVIGASDGIETILSAYTNPGDAIIIPNPGHVQYPAYLAKYGVEAVPVQLNEKNGYMPDPDSLSKALSKKKCQRHFIKLSA
jgi:LL-diaminopimelate aminotransferase